MKTKSYMVPMVVEQTGQGERAFDIYSGFVFFRSRNVL